MILGHIDIWNVLKIMNHNILERALSDRRRLDTIIVVSISETTVYVNNILKIVDGYEHASMITTCLSKLVEEVLSKGLPNYLASDVLCDMMLDNYRVFISISKHNKKIISAYIDRIIDIVKSKIPLLINDTVNVLVTYGSDISSMDKALLITRVTLNEIKTVHFKIFNREVISGEYNYIKQERSY